MILPWSSDTLPLMLAPMQGLTNRALRSVFINRVRPDVVFTEFVRVQTGKKKCISDSDKSEIANDFPCTPLVVQLIGCNTGSLVMAAEMAQSFGAQHLNINLGCPFGRMTSNSAGGALLKAPVDLPQMLRALRKVFYGSFSVKVRSGFDDPSQIFSLLPVFEDCGIDYLIVHPRTVAQKFTGLADHNVTAEVVAKTWLPVIANGDIRTAADGERVLSQTRAAGLMLGRGAIADPLLFERLRGKYPAQSTPEQRAEELRTYLSDLIILYKVLFKGDRQVTNKMKAVVCQMSDPSFADQLKLMRKAKGIMGFTELINNLSPE